MYSKLVSIKEEYWYNFFTTAIQLYFFDDVMLTYKNRSTLSFVV